MRNLNDLLERFPHVVREGQNAVVQCPAHDDQRPSLALAVTDEGRLLMTCRAGCETKDVLEKLGMQERDLFQWTAPEQLITTQPDQVGPAEIAAVAAYVDATSKRLREQDTDDARLAAEYVERRFGLTVDQAADLGVGVDPGGDAFDLPYLSRTYRAYPRLVVPFYDRHGTVRGLQGRDLSGKCQARWVSLSNPQGKVWQRYGFLRGGGSYGVVIITEGPGDALTAVAAGYDAVAVRGAAMSSEALASELAEALRDSLVVVAGDADEAGQRFTQTISAALRNHGVEVRHLLIPTAGDDLTDWRNRDPAGFAGKLHEAVRAARPVRTPEEERRIDAKEALGRNGLDAVTREDGERAAELYRAHRDRFSESDTDVMRAYVLVAFADNRIRHAPGLGFFVWDGRCWVPSESHVRQEVYRLGAALALAGHAKEARSFLMTRGIDNIIRELRDVPGVRVRASDFDARADLLAVRNGTIDLRTGTLRPHRREDMITRYVDVDYRPDAKCPRWEKFLEEIFPYNPELPAYMQRLVGYGITGSTAEQCFAVLWGKGANGKSVFMDTITSVFSAISRTTPFSTFEERSSGGIPNDLAALRGARIVRASEGDRNKPMAEGVLKQATGGNVLVARFLRQEFFEFTPTFLLLMDTNHKPQFRGQDDGLWRRVKMIPFRRKFEPHERDYELTDKLRAEAEGILAWAVRGAAEWYRNGLQDPGVVRKATKEYREISDALSGFLPGVLEKTGNPEDRVLGNAAFNAYLDWCEAENLPARERWKRQTFYRALEERGIDRVKTARGQTLIGVRLAANSPTAADHTSPQSGERDVFGQAR